MYMHLDLMYMIDPSVEKETNEGDRLVPTGVRKFSLIVVGLVQQACLLNISPFLRLVCDGL